MFLLYFLKKSAKVPIDCLRAREDKSFPDAFLGVLSARLWVCIFLLPCARVTLIGTLALFWKKCSDSKGLRWCRLSAD
jgi:hypothetical protein